MTDYLIALEKVSKVYGRHDGVRALDSIDLVIRSGERVAIMGPSGSGKSTLLNILAGLDGPTSGRVIFQGDDLFAMNDDDRTRLRREKIGMIFQTFNLLPTLSGIENVSLPLRLNGMAERAATEHAAEMLEQVGLSSRRDHRPDEMSGGERQRVAIARALIFKPPVLLADEPTGNLDSVSGAEVLRLLDEIHGELGTTIILVTHNEQAAEYCERHIALLDGKIISDHLHSAVEVARI
jgi:putative ABC transport system ATP-binding protein